MTIESLEDLKKQKQAESPATSYALETAYNIPSSTAKFVRDTIEPILSPIDTAKSVIELGKGIYNLSTPGEQPSEATARAVGKYFYDRYGGENLNQVKANISKTLKEGYNSGRIKHISETDPEKYKEIHAKMLSGYFDALNNGTIKRYRYCQLFGQATSQMHH